MNIIVITVIVIPNLTMLFKSFDRAICVVPCTTTKRYEIAGEIRKLDNEEMKHNAKLISDKDKQEREKEKEQLGYRKHYG